MSRSRIQAVSFDLDGTLLDNTRLQSVIARTCELLAENEPALEARALLEANGQIWPGYFQEIEEKRAAGILDGASVRLEAWRRTLKACNCNDESTAQLAARLAAKLGRDAHRLFDDVHEVVGNLRREGIPLALITNGASDEQREKLEVLGIEDWFDVIVIRGQHRIAKPDRRIFQLAAKGLRTPEANTCHVGDKLATDILGARRAGMTAVWLNRFGMSRQENDPEPHLEIPSLRMLRRIEIAAALE